MKNTITVFTPTYNRAHTLPELFDSLNNQTVLDFEWLIIDDGSTDDTPIIMESFKEEAKFPVKYLQQKNAGKHSAINRMLDITETELVLTLDSDDYLTNDAIETVLEDYKEIKVNKENGSVCEMLYLRKYHNNKIIGEGFHVNKGIIDPVKFILNENLGDKCSIIVTKVFNKYRFPVYENEIFMGESVLWQQVYDQNRKVFVRNKAIYFCEYLDDGLSVAGRQMRIKQPLGGMAHANSFFIKGIKMRLKFKYSILYICYGFFGKQTVLQNFKGIRDKTFYIPALPFGYVLYKLWGRKL